MAFRLDDHWIWDFWLADDEDTYHLFHRPGPVHLALTDPTPFEAYGPH